MYRTMLLDISGVLYQGDEVIPGAVDAVQRLRDAGVTLRFVTNTSRKPASGVLQKLREMGFVVHETELFTAPHAARRWLNEGGYRPLLIVHPDIEDEFAELETADPNAVLLADAEDGLNYANLDRAFSLLMDGAPLLAIGDNRYFHGGDRLHLDACLVKTGKYQRGDEEGLEGRGLVEASIRELVEWIL